MTRTTTLESFTRLAVILGTAQYNENGIATISREMVGEIQLTLKDAQAEIDALTAERDEARAALATRTDERDAALALIKSHHDARNEARRELAEAREVSKRYEGRYFAVQAVIATLMANDRVYTLCASLMDDGELRTLNEFLCETKADAEAQP